MLAALLMSAALCAAGCGGRYSAAVAAPASNGATRAAETGLASWYGDKYHGRRTASGEPFDMFAKTAAHRTLPFGTRVRVDNLDNGRSVTVRINDRGPFKDGRVIDLSYAAARELRMVRKGLARVRIRPIR